MKKASCDRIRFEVFRQKVEGPLAKALRVRAVGEGYTVGELFVYHEVPPRTNRLRKPYGYVGWIHVQEGHQRCGVATKMWSLAAQAACKEYGAPLASDMKRSAYAERFWQKQVKKGRARCVQRAGRPPDEHEDVRPMEGRGGCWFYQLNRCSKEVPDLSGRGRRRS